VVVLGLLAAAFKLWMITDALRRRLPPLWYVIVMLPLGDLIYFVVIKLRDFNVREGPAPVTQPARPSLASLEQAVAGSPSFDNRVQLGWALLDEGQPERAQGCFELALATHPNEKHALHGLGLSRLSRGNSAGAIEALSRLVRRSFAYQDYEAVLALAEALYLGGRSQEAFELLSDVVHDSRRLEHLLVLARYQLRSERKSDAQLTLRKALSLFETQPEPERRRNGAAATEARRLLSALDEPTP
jgi:hypothetical protein